MSSFPRKREPSAFARTGPESGKSLGSRFRGNDDQGRSSKSRTRVPNPSPQSPTPKPQAPPPPPLTHPLPSPPPQTPHHTTHNTQSSPHHSDTTTTPHIRGSVQQQITHAPIPAPAGSKSRRT